MKKLLSIVLTIAMLASMLSVPMVAGAKAYSTIDLSSGFVADATFGNANFKETVEHGVAGKDASDESMKLTENANVWTSWYSYNHGEEIYLENGQPMTGYLVMELNFMIPSTSKFSSWFFGLSTNQARLSEDVTEKAGLKRDQWNHIRLVYWADETNCDFKDYADNIPTSTTDKLGASETYLNGVKIGNTKQLMSVTNTTGSAYTAKIDTILFELYTADKGVQHSAYYDDLKIYKSATNPGAQANAALTATSEYTVSGNVVSLASGASLTSAEIAAANAGYTITAFENNTFSTQLTDSAVLAIDNVVVAKSPDGVYSYYTVSDAATKMLYSENDGSFASMNKASQTAVKGVAGKDADDESVLLAPNSAYDGNIMIATTYTKSKKYLVMEANVNPVSGDTPMEGVSIHTTSHGTVANAVALTMDQWNKYLMYVDFEANKTYVYVNGEEKGTNTPSANIKNSGASLRFCFDGKNKTPFSVYVDDMKWYETDTLPDGIAKTTLPVPSSSTYYSVADGNVKALPTTTVANIKTANADKKVRVYTDSTLTTLAEDSALATTGMAVVVEGNNKAIKAYPVVVSYGENEIYLGIGTSAKPFPDINNVADENKKATATGIGGKAADDVSMKIIQNNDDTWFGTTWGTTAKGTDAQGTGATWNKLDYKGYLVVEFSVFNQDCGTVQLVTDQSNVVVSNFASVIPKNQWSRVKIVVDATNGVKGGTAMAYVDGKAVSDTPSKHNLGTIHSTGFYYKNALRIQLKGGELPSYADDIRIYEIPALRPEQTIDFAAPDYCSATQNTFGYVDGDTVTVGEVKAANPGLDIKFFDNKTNYTEITSDSAVLAEGNVIYLNEQSQSTIDAGFNYKDLFRIMTVEKAPSTKDFISATPTSATRGKISAVTGGVYGNTSSSIKKVVNDATEKNWYFSHNHKGVGEGMNYLVLETDFASTADVSALYFGANGHGGLSERVYVGDGKQAKANQWHKLVFVYDMATDLCDTYVNGKLVSEDYKGCYSTKSAENSGTVNLRIIVEGSGKTAFESYFDNYRIYESVFYPEIGAPATLTAGYNASVSGFVDNTSMVANVKNGTSADIAVSGYDISVMDSSFAPVTGTIAEGNIILAKKNGNFAYYTTAILADNDIVLLGDTYNANTGVMNPGTVSAYGVTADGGVVVVAQFDENNNLIKAKASDDAVNGIVAVDFAADDIDDTVVRAYLFNNFNQITPLCANKEIKHLRNYNLLMLGNSFSMDVTCYMEEIAAAQGKKFNVAVHNKGGSSVGFHYENRELDPAVMKANPKEYGFMFWLNDVSREYTNLKTILENYEWDYVVIQNWGSDVNFYANTDANYAANWGVITDLAKYVHEKEPDAEIMLHETWSFEAGYNTWKDVATRDAAGEGIRALYDRCAREAATAIGQATPLRKISSLDAFEAARDYKNADGVKVFETTYDGTKHEFEFAQDDVKEVEVGDGSMLLSDEDAAEGKVSLHRDGFHASAAARYLIALNAVQFLTGKPVYGNTYRPGSIRLDSAGRYMDTSADMAVTSATIFQIYNPLAENVVEAIQTIVEGMR